MEEVNNERGNEVQRNTNSHNEIRIVRRRQIAIRGARSRFPLARRDGDALVATRRSHLYHGHCIVQWFNGRKFSCPVCRDESLLSQLQDAD
jgi:hypothetical protein